MNPFYKMDKLDHYKFLEAAIQQAELAWSKGNHPCGTVIVNSQGEVIYACANEVFTTPDLTAHAEILCIMQGSKLLMDKNQTEEFTLFSSMEPCCGCAFFIARTNIRRVVYAASDRYRPGIGMLKQNPDFQDYFAKIEVIVEPIVELRNRSLSLMKEYFIKKGKVEDAKYFEIPDASK